MLEPLQDINIDLIVSNPPYVPSAEVKHIDPSNPNTAGLLFEPTRALDGGATGHKYLQEIKDSGIPAILEGIGGSISAVNI